MWFIRLKTTPNQSQVFQESKEMFQTNLRIMDSLDQIQEEKACYRFQITKKML
jgi:hypothetical protein